LPYFFYFNLTKPNLANPLTPFHYGRRPSFPFGKSFYLIGSCFDCDGQKPATSIFGQVDDTSMHSVAKHQLQNHKARVLFKQPPKIDLHCIDFQESSVQIIKNLDNARLHVKIDDKGLKS
jgi:hypothetical protein